MLGEPTLVAIACELVAAVKKNITIDWTVRDNVRAQEGDSARVEYYEDGNSDKSEFGFLKVTIEARTLMCQFIGAASNQTLNQFTLDLDTHQYR